MSNPENSKTTKSGNILTEETSVWPIVVLGALIAGWYAWDSGPNIGLQVESASHQTAATAIAKSMVSDKLRSPSTASWVVVQVVAEEYPHYVVHVVVDAQNAFGAAIRDSFLVAFEVVDSETGKYRFNEYLGMIKSSNPPTPTEVTAMRASNWPKKTASK